MTVWQEAYKLALELYECMQHFSPDERYGLTSQIRRAGVSVCSNIAEGFGRRSTKEKDQFYAMANGSLTEVENQLLIAKGVGYLKQEQYTRLEDICVTVHKLLNALQKANKQRGAGSSYSKF